MSITLLTPDYLQGAITVEQIDESIRPWRTNYLEKELYPSINDGLLGQMEKPVGVRVRFACDSTTVTLSIKPSDEDRLFDLVLDNQVRDTRLLKGGEGEVVFDGLPGDDTPVEIWPGYGQPIFLTTIEGENVRPVEDPRLKWLTYGSSITQCGAATSPARSWPGTAARACDLNLTCMGFGGQCHLDSMIARLIRDREVDLLTLKLGINIMGAGSLSPRTFRGAVIGFVQIIRETHPDIPIGVISPIISPPRETNPNKVGFSLTVMREELMDAVDRIKRVTGDEKIFYFNGLNMFGESHVEEYLPDNLHPNGRGYEIMGEHAASEILPKLIAEIQP